MKKRTKEQPEKEENKTNWQEIIPLLKTPKGKAILFFAIYFIFFVVIICLARGQRGEVIGTNYEPGLPYSFNMTLLREGNYHFKYTYQLDQTMTSYEGDRNGDRQLFSDGVTSYFANQNNYLKQVDGLWVKTEIPYQLSKLLDVDTISNLIAAATYISKTQYEDGRVVVNFQITTNTLVKQLEGINIDLDSIVNEIIVSTDTEKKVTQVKYLLTDYGQYKQLITSDATLTLDYSNFGGVVEIEDLQ